MTTFYTIRFKRNAAKRFKNFSRRIAKTHSEALECILDFFQWHGISPKDRFENSIVQEITKNRKRSEALIAIVRDIEENQIKPTNTILQQLFQEAAKEEAVYDFGTPTLITENEELEYYRNECQKFREKKIQLQRKLDDLIDKVILKKRNFGKNYLSIDEYEELKKIYNVLIFVY